MLGGWRPDGSLYRALTPPGGGTAETGLSQLALAWGGAGGFYLANPELGGLSAPPSPRGGRGVTSPEREAVVKWRLGGGSGGGRPRGPRFRDLQGFETAGSLRPPGKG